MRAIEGNPEQDQTQGNVASQFLMLRRSSDSFTEATALVGWMLLTWSLLALLLVVPTGWPLATALAGLTRQGPEWAGELPRLGRLLGTTLAIAGTGSGLALLIGTPAALSLACGRRSGWGQVALILLLAGVLLPLPLSTAGWLALVGPDGWWRPTSNSLTVERWLLVALLHGLAAVPWVVASVLLGLTSISRAEQEALLLVGPPSTLWRWLLLPRLRPALAGAALLAAIPPLTDMSISDLFRVRTFAEEVYTQFEEGSDAALATLGSLAPCMVAGLGLILLVGRHAGSPPGQGFLHAHLLLPGRGPLGRALQAGTLAAVALTVLPVFGLLWQLGLRAEPDGTVRWYLTSAGRYLGQALPLATLLVNLGWAAVASSVALAAGLLIAWEARRWPAPGRQTLAVLCLWSLLIPGPVLGMGLVDLLNRPGPLGWLYDSPGAMVYGQVVRLLPWAIVGCWVLVQRVPNALLDSARVFGAGWSAILVRLVVPATFGSLARLGALLFALALAELPVTKLLAPPGEDPLSVRLFALLHTGTGNQQAAVGLVLWAGVLIPVLAALAHRTGAGENPAGE